MEAGPRPRILLLDMSISGIRTAALTLAVLLVATEGGSIAALVTGLGKGLGNLVSPSFAMLGAVAGLALIAFRPSRR